MVAASWPRPWSAGVTVPAEDTQGAVRAVDEELRRLRDEPVPEEEMARVRGTLIGRLALTRDRPADLMVRLMEAEEYGVPPDYWQSYPARVRAVTALDVRRIARKYLAADKVQIIAIGPAARIERGLRPEGTVDHYDAYGYPAAEKRPLPLPLPDRPFGL